MVRKPCYMKALGRCLSDLVVLADYQETGHEGEVTHSLRAAPCRESIFGKKRLKH